MMGAHGLSPGAVILFRRKLALTVFAWVFLLGGARLLGGAPLAFADTEGDRSARLHFRQGEAFYNAGKYADALAAYQAGYAVEPLPGFLVNIAQCQRRMGDLQHARASYGKFVLVAPDSPLAPEVRGLIAELDRLIAETAAADGTAPGATAGGASASGTSGGHPVARSALELESLRNDVLPLDAVDSPAPVRHAAGAELVLPPRLYAAPATGDTVTTVEATATAAPSRRWWLWGAVGAAVVGVAAVTWAVMSAPEGTTIHDGSLGTLRR